MRRSIVASHEWGVWDRRDGRVVNAVRASRAEVRSHVDAVSSGRSWLRFPGLAGYFEEGFYGFLSSWQVNAEVDIRP